MSNRMSYGSKDSVYWHIGNELVTLECRSKKEAGDLAKLLLENGMVNAVKKVTVQKKTYEEFYYG